MVDSRLTLKKSSNGQQIPIAGSVSVGRDEGSTLRLAEGQASRRHAQISVDGSAVFVEDLGSANGTFVNDKRIDANSKVQVKPGDRLRFDIEEFVLIDALATTVAPDKTATEQTKLPDSFFAPTGKQTTYIPPEKRAALKAKAAEAAQEAPAPGGMPYLRIVSGERSGTRFELPVEADTPKTWSIGSQADRDICLKEPEVSAKHATLKHDKNAWLLSDDLSVNGTAVNGEKILTRYLADCDRLQFGLIECEFRIPPRAEVQRGPAPLSKWILIGGAAFVLTLALVFAIFKMSK
jgi:pSer/pThr/pTyr-binding forkhead associated (FHA) protein